MLRLREEVKGLHGAELVASLGEQDEVAHLRGGIAGDIDDAFRAEGEELLQKLGAASGTRRVDEHDGVGPGMRHVFEDMLRIGGDEAAVRERLISALCAAFLTALSEISTPMTCSKSRAALIANRPLPQ
jgi:hypothetical protein